MGVTVPRNTILRGLPFSTWKALMRIWPRSKPRIWNLGDNKALSLDPYQMVALVDEAEHQNLITGNGGRHRGSTERGDALGGARIGAKQPRAKVESLLEDILVLIEGVNANPTLPFRVERVLLYGSLLDPTVGEVSDLDIYVTTTRLGEWDAIKDRYAQLDGFASYDECGLWWHPEHVERRLIFGARKHPLLGKDTVSDPVSHGFPHRCVFDAARGGRVDDPIVPENPRAPYREGLKNRITDVPFEPSPLRCVDAKWFRQTFYADHANRSYGPWVGSSSPYAALRESPLSLHFIARPDDAIARRYAEIDGHGALRDLDGRARTALVVTRRTEGCRRSDNQDTFFAAFVLTRTIAVIDDTAVHMTRLVDLIAPVTTRADEDFCEEVWHAKLFLAWGIHALITADRHLVGMIDADGPHPFEEWVKIALPTTATSFLADQIRHDLHIYLGPDTQWSGQYPATPSRPGETHHGEARDDHRRQGKETMSNSSGNRDW